MARGLAFFQFVLVGLGVFALHTMARLGDTKDHPGLVAEYAPLLARHGLWLFAVPILWAALATGAEGRLRPSIINGVGLVVTAALFLVLAVPLFYYLR